MVFYVGLRNETLQEIIVRYKRSGIFSGNSSIATAHNSAAYLFPVNTNYIIITEQDRVVGKGITNYSYWENILNRPIPNFGHLKASERAYLYIPSGL